MKKIVRFWRASLFISLLVALAADACAQTSSSNSIPLVTIQATQPIASGPGSPGIFTVFRAGNTNETLNVFYQIGGSANNGLDYAQIPNFVEIAAGAISNNIVITPLANPAPDSAAKTVTLQLGSSPLLNPVNYEIGVPSNAVVYLTGSGTHLPPVVNIINPANGSTFYSPTNILLEAQANDPDGSVTNVEFFAGANDLGPGTPVVLDPPGINGVTGLIYIFNWQNVPVGSYFLTAVATDDHGSSTVSPAVNTAVLTGPAATNGYITAVLRSACTSSPIPPPPVGETRVGPDYVIETVADADPGNWTNAQQLATDAIFESLMPLYCALPQTGCLTGSVQWNIITYGTNGSPMISGCAASGCELHSCQGSTGPAVIVTQPANQSVYVGQTATFSVIASGAAPLIYQWVIDGTNILDGATNAALVLPDVQTNQAGSYQVVVYNSLGGTNSQPATLTVNRVLTTNPPPVVRIVSPANGSVFRAPIDLPLVAYVNYPADSTVSVEFYDGTNDLGPGRPELPPTPVPLEGSNGAPITGPVPPIYPTNLFVLNWTNAPIGNHVLTAQATIFFITHPLVLLASSAPVDIAILPPLPPPTNLPAVVNIVATDPVAIEGTNCWVWPGEPTSPPTWAAWPATACQYFTNYGPKTATFTIRRFGETNNNLTVTYDIGGTASNGVDYVALPGFVTIPATERAALITIVPIDDGPPDIDKTVILSLTPSTNMPLDYLVGYPPRAAVIIVDRPHPWPASTALPDKCFHLSLPGPDAAWFSVEYSTNLTDWTPICTNQVINGSIDFIDPDASANVSRFYRAVAVTNGPTD